MNTKEKLMDVLVLATDFPPSIGGIQNVVYNLCQHLTEAEIHVIAPDAPGAGEFDAGQSFRISRVRAPFFKRRLLLSLLGLRAIHQVLRDGVDLILCAHPFITPFAAIIKMLFRKPYVVFVYAMELRSKNFKRFGLIGLKNADRVFAISEFTRQEVLKFGVPPEKIVKVRLGVDPSRWSSCGDGVDVLEKYGLAGKRILLSVARLEDRYKGHDTVIRAMPMIAAKVPDACYVVVGDGWLRPYLGRVAKAFGVGDRVLFLGRVSDPELKQLYEACDAFIMVSRERAVDGGAEGFGLVLLEANFFGKPVIGGQSGGIPDAVIDGVTGILVDPEDEKEVAEAAVNLFTDKELAKRLGRQGRERVLSDLAWPMVVAQIGKILREVVDEKKGRS